MPLLQEPSPRLTAAAAAMTADDPAALDAALDALDPDEWVELEQLIGTASTRSVRSSRSRQAQAPPRGDVILLPGVMGTDLGVIEAGVATALWFNVLALSRGGLAKLRLPVDGSPPGHDIVTGGPLKLFYLPMQMTLNQRFRTRLFPYDWRLDLMATADRLAEEVAAVDGRTVHLVAHSMGGLVSRAMIQRHPDVWQRMGGRLIMMGTPNRGAFAPVLALTGKDRKLRLLALLDATMSKREIIDIVATFPGLVQMLPSAKVALDVDALYECSGWPDAPVHQSLLDLARDTHDRLHDVIDVERMIYIAGYGHATVDGVDRSSGRFRYHRSRAGDGTVPHTLGRLPGVPTFWTPANHGGLVKDESVLAAVSELLTDGVTNRLPLSDRPPAARGDAEETWIDDDELESEVMRAVDRARRDRQGPRPARRRPARGDTDRRAGADHARSGVGRHRHRRRRRRRRRPLRGRLPDLVRAGARRSAQRRRGGSAAPAPRRHVERPVAGLAR